MPRNRRKRPSEIEASRIVLRDNSGRPRIVLDAGGDDGSATFGIYSPDMRQSMSVTTQPSGAVVMSFGDQAFDGMLTLSTGGIVLRARDGKLGIVVGPIVDGEYSITVHREGQPVWKSPAPPR